MNAQYIRHSLAWTLRGLTTLALLTACTGLDAPLPTFTPAFSGPTIAPSPQPFLGPPTEGPPLEGRAVGMSDPTAAAQPNQGALPPRLVNAPDGGQPAQTIEITAFDGAPLAGLLYQIGTERRPGVLLLGLPESDWGEFPAQLSAEGFTVLVIGLRAGGDERDVQAMIEALISGAADPAHIAVIGASRGADAALTGCALMPACDTVVLLSPLDQRAGLAALAQFNPRPVMLAASEEDADSFAVAQALNAAAAGDKLFQPLAQAGHGTALLINRPDLGGLIVDWLRRQLV